MDKIIFATFGSSPALIQARNRLESWGYAVTPLPCQASHIILPVPSGNIWQELPPLPPEVTVFGGHLPPLPYRQVDLLQDGYYLLENASITAQCALRYANIQPGTPVLVIGWGRIGKHLAALLADMGASVTVAARKASDRAELARIGMEAVDPACWEPRKFAVVYNTAPAPVLHERECAPGATLVDLASQRGIEGDRVIWARGLPGKDAPELSGNLIAKTILRYALRKE